jgi:hypothetical protein
MGRFPNDDEDDVLAEAPRIRVSLCYTASTAAKTKKLKRPNKKNCSTAAAAAAKRGDEKSTKNQR